jgi:hypothetical protein
MPPEPRLLDHLGKLTPVPELDLVSPPSQLLGDGKTGAEMGEGAAWSQGKDEKAARDERSMPSRATRAPASGYGGSLLVDGGVGAAVATRLETPEQRRELVPSPLQGVGVQEGPCGGGTEAAAKL